MIWTLLPFGLVVILVAAILLLSRALVDRPAGSSEEELHQGQDPLADCLAGGEGVAQMDKHEAH
jgi:hypothetical protein